MSPSDDEFGPNTSSVASKRETHFVPRSDDEEVLWTVQEITAERGRKYKVKWAGTDPATGKPWAQSWVAKHDCTDDLVEEWMAKKERVAERKKRGGRGSTVSRASGSSKLARSSTSGKKTRPPTSEATSSRLNSVQEHLSPPPSKSSTTKRKRQSETPATTSSGVVQADEQSQTSGPRKRRKMVLETALAPISSTEEEDGFDERAKVAVQNKAPLKSTSASLDDSDRGDSPPPMAKSKSVRSKGASEASDLREESRLRDMKTKIKDITRRDERVADPDAISAGPSLEEPRQLKSKKKSRSKRKPTLEQNDDQSREAAALKVAPAKVGHPPGVKRGEALRKSAPPSKPGPSRAKSREDDPADRRVSTEESKSHPDDEAFSSTNPGSLRQNADNSTSIPPPLQISIPQAPVSASHNPDLSPGAKARLEIFDRMIGDFPCPGVVPSPVDVPERIPDDTHFNDNDIHDTHDYFEPHPLSPLQSKSKPKHAKMGPPDGLIVPETESSGNSQSQSQRLPLSPQPPPVRESSRELLDLPPIAVIIASAPSRSTSPQGIFPLPPRLLPSKNRPSKRPPVKPVLQISPNTFRSAINVRSHVTDSEPPPSSIESFTSPKRVDKGKQRAIEDDQFQNSLSEGEGDGERWKPTRKRMTDSKLKKRGKELFDQAQLAREAERLKRKKLKRLKTVVNRTTSSRSVEFSLPLTSGAEGTFEIPRKGVPDLRGGANDATLDTAEHSETKVSSEEQRERLRIELRQEEEENTQEAMGIYPPLLPIGESDITNGRDARMLSPKSPEHFQPSTRMGDVDHVEQPSADLQLASVIVQPSQEDTDVDVNQPTSSPPRPIPENLSDSPKRRLGEALSLLNVKSEEIQRLERELSDERTKILELKLELTERQQSSEPTGPVLTAWEAERAEWTQERTEWERQHKVWSDDKANLSARVAELSDGAARAEQIGAKLAELEAERVAWTKERDAPLRDLTQRSEESVNTHGEDARNWEAERISWAEEKARWETDRAALQDKQETLSHSVDELTTSVKSLGYAKDSAEKDRDFFREQYAQASKFVGSIREENVELEKRVKIAEGQAQEGVSAIKALYEGRIRALQTDVGRWKGLTELLQEKDTRTNDEVRLRAAQAPEFSDLCNRLTSENESLKADTRKLGQAQQRSISQRNRLYHQILVLKKERAALKSKLSKRRNKRTQETLLVAPDPESLDLNDILDPTPQSSDASFDEPALFPCMWRPQWRDQCQHVFDAKEDLERHVQEHFDDLLSK